MDPKEFLRTLRRRWLILFVCAAVGAVLGYASTLLGEEDTGPVVQHWAASEILVLNPDSDRGIDLQRLAPFVTKGDIPLAVASARDMELLELESRLRTVADFSEGTFTISAVATSAENARDIALEVRDELLRSLNADGQAAYDEQLRLAEELVTERSAAVVELDRQLAALGEADEVERRSVESLRTTAVVRLGEAQEAVRDIQRFGPAPAELIPLDKVPPFRISAREYDNRLARARQGENNYTVGEVELADTSRPTVSERLENPAARGLLGAVAGAVLAMMAIGIHYKLDPRLRTREQFERAFALPVLTTIPNFPRKDRKESVLHAKENPRSAVAEAYRYLRSVLLFARSGMSATDAGIDVEAPSTESTDERAERDVRVVMVTSAGEGEGKTTTAANLAVLLAESGYDTMFVNCDFRLPSAHKLLKVDYEPGTVTRTGIPNLRFISDVKRSEDDTPGQVSERQRRLIARARGLVDVVILDTAPLLATNDAIDIMPETDLAVLVAREGKTTGDAAAEARELIIDRLGVPVAGVVVTAGGSGLDSGYYEKYRYGSYFNRDAPNLFTVGKQLLFGKKKAPKEHKMPDEHFDPPSDPTYLPDHAAGEVEEPTVLTADTDPVDGLDEVPSGSAIFSMHDVVLSAAGEAPVADEPELEPQLPSAPAHAPARLAPARADDAVDRKEPVGHVHAFPRVVRPVVGTHAEEKGSKESSEPPTFRPEARPVPIVADDEAVDAEVIELKPEPEKPQHAPAEATAGDDAGGAAGHDDTHELSEIDLRFRDWLARRDRDANVDVD